MKPLTRVYSPSPILECFSLWVINFIWYEEFLLCFVNYCHSLVLILILISIKTTKIFHLQHWIYSLERIRIFSDNNDDIFHTIISKFCYCKNKRPGPIWLKKNQKCLNHFSSRVFPLGLFMRTIKKISAQSELI